MQKSRQPSDHLPIQYYDTSKIPSNLMRPGGNQRRQHGISLPKSLLEEIDASEQGSHRHKNSRSHTSRKDARKQERADRKKRKADHFIQSAHSAKRKTEEEHVNSPQRKRTKTSQESVPRPPTSKSHNVTTTKVHRITDPRNCIPPPSRSRNSRPLR
ncbi:hypothetical protein BDR07DRAFT_207942 [Suillus spraguei]|nr:hypothetical protein BDR07DRAFT_207942 [Suillus spraguei]